MAKTIKEMAIDYRQDFIENGVNEDVANDHKDSFEIGANAVLKEIVDCFTHLSKDNPILLLEHIISTMMKLKGE